LDVGYKLRLRYIEIAISAPRDIYEYYNSNAAFPHQSTAAQFFSESQFESDQILGLYTMKKICPGRPTDFESCISRINDYLGTPDSGEPEIRHA